MATIWVFASNTEFDLTWRLYYIAKLCSQLISQSPSPSGRLDLYFYVIADHGIKTFETIHDDNEQEYFSNMAKPRRIASSLNGFKKRLVDLFIIS